MIDIVSRRQLLRASTALSLAAAPAVVSRLGSAASAGEPPAPAIAESGNVLHVFLLRGRWVIGAGPGITGSRVIASGLTVPEALQGLSTFLPQIDYPFDPAYLPPARFRQRRG